MVSLFEYPIKRQDRRNHCQRNLPVQQRERAHRNQRVVEYRQNRGHSVDPFKAEAQVDQHSAQRIQCRQDRLLAQLLSHLRPHDLDIADAKVRDKKIIRQRGNHGGIGRRLQFLDRPQHAAFRLVAIVDNGLRDAV